MELNNKKRKEEQLYGFKYDVEEWSDLEDEDGFKSWSDDVKDKLYKSALFLPGKSQKELDLEIEVNGNSSCFNLWKPIFYEPKKGILNFANLKKDISEWKTLSNLELYLWIEKNVICDGSSKHFVYLCNWKGLAVQKPNIRPNTIPFYIGMDDYAQELSIRDGFGNLFSDQSGFLCTTKLQTFKYNNWLSNQLILEVNQNHFNESKKYSKIFTNLVNDDELFIKPKRSPGKTEKNYLHIILKAFKKEKMQHIDDRIQFVEFHHSNMLYNKYELIGKCRDAIKKENLLNELHDFYLTLDLTDFDPQEFPK